MCGYLKLTGGIVCGTQKSCLFHSLSYGSIHYLSEWQIAHQDVYPLGGNLYDGVHANNIPCGWVSGYKMFQEHVLMQIVRAGNKYVLICFLQFH